MDYLYRLMGFIIGPLLQYRYQVALQNLSRAFPEASYLQIKEIHRQFYNNLARIVLESIVPALQGLSLEENSKELLHSAALKHKNIILLTGHYGNWEIVSKLPALLGRPVQALYKPLQNKFWDKRFVQLRSSKGLRLLPSKQALRILLKEGNSPHTTLFVADQYPGKGNGLAIDFLNQPSHMFQGAEQLAKRLDAAVVYMELAPQGKTSWEASFQLICTDARQTQDGFITSQYTRKLEQSIRHNPAYWLWSHKRWK